MGKMIKHNKLLSLLLVLVSGHGLAAEQSNAVASAVKERVQVTSSQSYTLEQALDYALANNPDLQIAGERIGQAQAQLGEVLSAFYPQISARVGYDHSNNPAQVFSMIVAQRDFTSNSILNINNPGYRQNFRPEIIGKLSLFRGGQDYQNSLAAKLGIAAAEYERSTIRNALAEAVTGSFYAYFAAQEAQKVAKEQITAIASELGQTTQHYEGGTVLKSEVLTLQSKQAEAEAAEITAANAIEISKTNIANLLGLPASQAFSIVGADWDTPKQLATYDDLLDVAMSQRPEIKAAGSQVEMIRHKVKSEQGAYLPRADAYVSYGQNSQSPGFSSDRENVTAGVAVEMDLFSGFNTKQRVRSAELKLKEAQDTERKTKLQIEQEVKLAYLKLQEALSRLHVAESSVLAADEAFRLVNEERKAEIVTVTRYIESEVAKNKAQSNVIAAHYDALTADATLKKAIGAWK
jgi:outer membrane protein TolC